MISNKVADSSKHPTSGSRTPFLEMIEEFCMEEHERQSPSASNADPIAPPIKKIWSWKIFWEIGCRKMNPATVSGTLLQTNT